MTTQRGILIAVEGCDRGGKTTQCKLLQEWLYKQFNTPSEYIKFPGTLIALITKPFNREKDRTTPIGVIINEYLTKNSNLNDQAIHLLFSANRWELKDKMEAYLQEGNSLVLDRYVHSGVAYSAAKGLDLNWCKSPENGLPKPDLVIFMNVPIEGSSRRDGYGGERYEIDEMQIRVRAQYDALKDDSWIVVDGVGSIEEVSQRIQKEVYQTISSLLENPKELQRFIW